MNKIIKIISALLMVICLFGCTSFPMLIRWRPMHPRELRENNSIVFQQPVDIVRKAAMFAATNYGTDFYKITKSEPRYIEVYFLPWWGNIQVGIVGGETVGIWLEPLGESQTRVVVNTAKSKGLSWLVAEQEIQNKCIIDDMKKFIKIFEEEG